MSKHPGPWRISSFGTIFDENDDPVAGLYTTDPETRAVLLHAAEMWESIHAIVELYRLCGIDYHYAHDAEQSGDPLRDAAGLHDKIESEIAAARKP